MTNLSRRGFAALGLSSIAYPAFAANAPGFRSFDILRGSKVIGEHVVTVDESVSGLSARTEIDIAVKVLGFTAYRYEMSYTEEYDASRRLLRLDASCRENGKPDFARVIRGVSGLEIDGSANSGIAPTSAYPTSYWLREAQVNTPWISTQTGALLPVTLKPVPLPQGAGAGAAQALRASDGEKFDITMMLDARGEWIGSSFEARGEQASFRLRDESGALNG